MQTNNLPPVISSNGKLVNLKYYPYLVTGEELLKLPFQKIPCLWEPFFIKEGLIALTGASDLGKSSILRQFAISVALKEKSFLGSPLNAQYGRVLYLATEDSRATAQFTLQRSLGSSVKPEELKGLCYLINPDNPLKAIEEQLKIAKTDVVIIDSFGDVFSGNLNDNNHVRKTLNQYQKLSDQFNTLFIFLHHTGKRTEQNSPSKNNVIGSQGFEAKMRLVMELRKPDDSGKRILHFTKGNYLSDTIKNRPMELFFDDKQIFHFKGTFSAPNNIIKEGKFSASEKSKLINETILLKKQGMSFSKIVEEFNKKKYENIPAVGTLHNWIKEFNAIHST